MTKNRTTPTTSTLESTMSRTKQPDHPRREYANATRQAAVQLRRRSNAAGSHDSRTNRERTRANRFAAEVRVNGWER